MPSNLPDRFRPLFRSLPAVFLLLAAFPLRAAWGPVWSLGTDDNSNAEFSEEWMVDDDFTIGEALTGLERSLSKDDATVRIHFPLTAAQRSVAARLRLRVDFTAPGWMNPAGEVWYGAGWHDVEVRLNGVVIRTLPKLCQENDTAVVEFLPGTVAAVAGDNVLQLRRTGGSDLTTAGTPSWSWISLDYLSLEADPAGQSDGDGDGIPAWWENDRGLSDAVTADASTDRDHDGLTELQEFQNSTDPLTADTDGDGLSDAAERLTAPLSDARNPDTDGDGLTDAAEKNGSPATNPALADTDGDGASDAWERQAGTNPLVPASVPPAFAQAVGLDFVIRNVPDSAPAAATVAGVFPQPNWNRTSLIPQWAPLSWTQSLVEGPLPGVLADSSGAPSGITCAFSAPYAHISAAAGSPDLRLLEGFLSTSDMQDASVTLSNIPWASYDVIVHVAANYSRALGSVQIAGNTPSRRYFRTSTSGAPVEATTTQAQLDAAAAGVTDPQEISRRQRYVCRSAHYVRFRNLSGSSVTVQAMRGDGDVGIAAVQIVNMAADRDGDGMPDAWEFAHALNVTANDAAGDADGDGLANSAEFNRGSSPRRTDTDADGLNDAAEPAANVLNADSDGDGLNDGAEVNAARPTNPNLADSDGDGLSDTVEIENFSDPLTTGGAQRPVPVFTASPRSWTWQVDAQIVLDRTTAPLTTESWGDRVVTAFGVHNPADSAYDSLTMYLMFRNGALNWMLHTTPGGSFSQAGNPGAEVWHTDSADLTALLGLSGYGTQDISDRLRFSLTATRPGSSNSWNLVFQILNLDRPAGSQVIATRTINGTTAAASVNAGTATWRSRSASPWVTGQCGIELLEGVDVYLGYPALETLPAFAAALDTDEDGMPDVWEDANAFSKTTAADATQDTDSDGLNNRGEFLAGTNPRDADSDNDGVRDGDEVIQSSDPLLASSRPPFFNAAPAGEDLNANGLSDVWELWSGAWSLTPSADTDGDGMTNLAESRAGTDPLDAASHLHLDLTQPNAATLQLRWPAVAHKRYRLMQSPTLSLWNATSGTASTAGGEMVQSVPSPVVSGLPRLFYRADVEDLDTDGDGLSDWAEFQLGSSPLSASSLRAATPLDTNGDGIPDGSVAGDLAAYAERMLGAQAAGGYPGSSGGSVSRVQAARLLTQATFGPTMAEIDRAAQLGTSAWITDQMAKPPSLYAPYMRRIYADFYGAHTDRSYNFSELDSFLYGNNFSTPFFRAAVSGEDQLRQRVAFALSQILVVSRRDANLENVPLALAEYYDIFVRHAFGNYLDILSEVTLHPVMGRYLSHVGNQKANPALNQYPDENYAREVMQLFTIGLWQLNPDGSRKLDAQGQPIPTYSNTQITELARVFTGLWFSGQEWLQGGWQDEHYAIPMGIYPDRHDFGVKTLAGGKVIPARAPTAENVRQDIRDALKSLLDHPNTPVFVSRQLIQFLVTSNPSPAYVQRVQSVFVNNGSGVRGDLGAVVRAILMDEEARDPRWSQAAPAHGKLREPVLRIMHLVRAGGLARVQDAVWWNWGEFPESTRQEPLYSPSVFNFYRPDYRAPGLLTQQGLDGPVFQITDSYSAISLPNLIWQIMQTGLRSSNGITYPLDFADETALASSPELLVDRVNLLFCAGRMTAATHAVILDAVDDIPATQARSRAHLAVYLAVCSPDGAVQR